VPTFPENFTQIRLKCLRKVAIKQTTNNDENSMAEVLIRGTA